MHNEIMGFKGADHIDHDGLNNQKSNLRKANQGQNCANRKKSTTAKSFYKGVYWNEKNKKWKVSIMKNGKSRHLGYFALEIDAAIAYDKAATELFGEFANLNFKEENNEKTIARSGI